MMFRLKKRKVITMPTVLIVEIRKRNKVRLVNVLLRLFVKKLS